LWCCKKYANLHKAEIDIKENGIKSLQVIEKFFEKQQVLRKTLWIRCLSRYSYFPLYQGILLKLKSQHQKGTFNAGMVTTFDSTPTVLLRYFGGR
jgi:hypothetical protein